MSASRVASIAIAVAVLFMGVMAVAGAPSSRPLATTPPVDEVVPVLYGGPSEERDSIVAYEARLAGMDPALAVAVSHVENWSGDSIAVHPRSGATGLMQVMPFWADSFQTECYGQVPLIVRRRNACVGVQIAMQYFRACGNWNCALVRYVGAKCTRRDTPARCARKMDAGTAYVLEVVERFGRDDLSPARDAMAYGLWRKTPGVGYMGSDRPARNPRLDPHSSGSDTAWRRARGPGTPLHSILALHEP